MKDYYPISISRPDVPLHILKAVTGTYPDTMLNDDNVLVGQADAPPEVINDDLNFWLAHPTIPAENVCSRLGNYRPKTPSQALLAKAASYLVNEGSTERAMGLFAHGDPGLGKTHISVGIAKEVAARGQGKVSYFNTATEQRVPTQVNQYEEMADEGRGIVILDDVNSAYGNSEDALRAAISGMHNVGGRLFITSNAPDADAFLRKALRPSTAQADLEFVRLNDRMRGMLRIIQLEGESHRAKVMSDPWAGFSE